MGSDMTVLVGDVGGSNTRLALAGPEIGVTALQSFANDSFSSLDDVLVAYCAQPDLPPLAGACIAVAGPVYGNEYQLTNRNWQGSAADLAQQLQLGAGARVDVINDLAALGHSLPALIPGQLSSLRAGHQRGTQALVAGIGTGFNVSLSVDGHTAEAEMGHTSLSAPVACGLTELLGDRAGEFATNEDLFSGRGLVRYHQALHGIAAEGGAQIVADYLADGDSPAAKTVTSWARLLGDFARELVPTYMPGQGIFFAGSVARGILGTAACEVFLNSFLQPATGVQSRCETTPLWLITDDAAGVSGAARFALERAGRKS
ncbi:glucokinase [Phaeobacter inhibens]|uniref:glucokinase n=2 Tax=Phaeobacter inhibens TaxID=221822 RepID=UPI0021A8F693|nr:glucokinase [Phaeobacter inhibens]UWR40512.1 glucokinase [Phaeobacter inhibens]UWR69083.1 glucokinase [Phaeobacter inhibens]UWR80825.1 glucokinase [Phaeobacter inhibens]UWS00771.1 glucokinase [Phaeobacter inhibens]